MDIVIEYQGVKRAISGPFNILATRADFMALRDQLARGCVDDFCYGWVDIRTTEAKSKPDTPPISWKAAGTVAR